MDHEKRFKRKIRATLREPTGMHFLDSGRLYGRHWQRNQSRRFEDEERYMVFVHADEDGKPEEIFVLYNLYHYLIDFLSLNKETDELNRMFNRFSSSRRMREENQLIRMEAFLEEKLDVTCTITNTYNHPNLLSQVIQYGLFTWGENNDRKGNGKRGGKERGKNSNGQSNFIILQLHNGCDVRGGYTEPCIFSLDDVDGFLRVQTHVEVFCRGIERDPLQTCFEGIEEGYCGNRWSSDDAGLNYAYEGNLPGPRPIEDHTRYDKDTGKLTCRDCGGVIMFST